MTVPRKSQPSVVGNNETTPPKKLGGVTGKGFMPGQSGNPSGRRKHYITQGIMSTISEDDAAKFGAILREMALAGDLKAMEMILDRVEGKAIARQEQGQPGEFDTLQSLQELSSDDLRSIVKLADRKAS